MTKNEIIAKIAERTDISRTDVRLFLDKLNETLFQGLNEDQLVKIKGLGTFKMVSVKARKSVSVNGGEEIEIPAHNKITFTADKLFAEMVNEPLAHLAVVELSDTQSDETDPAEESANEYVASTRMKKLGEDAEALKGLLADINGVAETAPADEKNENSVDDGEDRVVEVQAEEKVDAVQAEEKVEEHIEEQIEESVHTEEKQMANSQITNNNDVEEECKTGMTHGGKIGRIFLWGMVFLLIVFASIYWVNFRKVAEVPAEEPEVVVVRQDTTAVRQDTVAVADDTTTVELPAGRLTIEQMRMIKIDYSTLQGTETVRDGSRLTMIALRAYGNKEFWIYLFLANRDQLSNPGQITTGMVIKIPKIDSRLIDDSNPDCLLYAKELREKYVK